MSVWDFEAAVERRDATGGTSKRSVLEQADKLEAWAEPSSSGGKRARKETTDKEVEVRASAASAA